mgnify:CR=1 FL=1
MMISQFQREFLANFGASYSSQIEILMLFKKISESSGATISHVWKTVASELDEETFNELYKLIETGDNYFVKSYKYNIIFKRHEENPYYIRKARDSFEEWSHRIMRIYASLKIKSGRRRANAFNFWLKDNQQFIIENHSILTVSEIAKTLGVSKEMISHARRKLYEKGLIIKEEKFSPRKERTLLERDKAERLAYDYYRIIKYIDEDEKMRDKNEK